MFICLLCSPVYRTTNGLIAIVDDDAPKTMGEGETKTEEEEEGEKNYLRKSLINDFGRRAHVSFALLDLCVALCKTLQFTECVNVNTIYRLLL